MDDQLISAVFVREALWNPMHKQHKNANYLKKMWDEVATEMKKDEKTIRTRWKNLRAYFMKENQKLQKPKSGDGASDVVTSSWQYYDQLKFLKVSIPVIDRAASLPECTDFTSDTMDTEDTEDIGFQEPQSPIPSTSSESNTAPFPSRKKNRSKSTSDSQRHDALIELEKKKIEILEQDMGKSANDDLLFFESLLPFMKEIPMVRKLRLRSKIQDLILNELEVNHGPQEQQNNFCDSQVTLYATENETSNVLSQYLAFNSNTQH